MSAKILSFTKARRRAEKAASSRIKKPKETTLTDVFTEVRDDVIREWWRYATKNQLSDFIEARIPSHVRPAIKGDYVNDLNVLSRVERDLGMSVSVFYPGTTWQNPHGWMAAFHRGSDVFSTPPDMASEASARALNILLCLAFTSYLRKIGRG